MMISVVVPTFREVDNLEPLARALDSVMDRAGMAYELLIVDDDSDDGILELAAELSAELPLRIHCRTGVPRDLSLAVLDGLRLASSDLVVVMDADLSHPPEAIPEMVKHLEGGRAAMVVGSRYVDGGSFDRSWNLMRYINSHLATLLASPLVDCSDPMSGFFALNRTNLPDDSQLRPIGYKIGLEILVKGDFVEVIECPIRFRDREKGQSKMNVRQQWNYLRHLRRLYFYRFPGPTELIHFLVVGGGGFLIDVTCYYLLQLAGVEHRLARAISFWPAVTSNWVLNRTATFGNRSRRPRLKQWSEFVLSCLVGFTMNWGGYFLLTTHVPFFDRFRLLALFVGVVLGTVFNFTMASLYVYSEKRSDAQ